MSRGPSIALVGALFIVAITACYDVFDESNPPPCAPAGDCARGKDKGSEGADAGSNPAATDSGSGSAQDAGGPTGDSGVERDAGADAGPQTEDSGVQEDAGTDAGSSPSDGGCSTSCSVPVSCTNHIKDGDETSVDCGGSTCGPCQALYRCSQNSDCQSGVCTDLILRSDTSWKASESVPSDWMNTGFDDSSWIQAVDEGPYGVLPWNDGTDLPPSFSGRWIWTYDSHWYAKLGSGYLRRKFIVPEPGGVTILMTVDDEYTLYVNGTLIGSDTYWKSGETYRIDAAGGSTMVIAIEGRNTGYGAPPPDPSGGAAGLLLEARADATFCAP